MRRRNGEIDPKAERYGKEARRPLSEHLADFRQYLADKQNTPKYVELVCGRVAKLVDDCKAERIADLTDAAVMAAIGAMKVDDASLQTLTQEPTPEATAATGTDGGCGSNMPANRQQNRAERGGKLRTRQG